MGAAGTSGRLASVVSLHRYPVKSMLGERVCELAIDERGIMADRRWSVRTTEGKIGSGKNTRRFAAVPRLQQVRAHLDDGGVLVTLPDGSRHHVESAVLQERLSEIVGEPVRLAPESDVSHFDDGSVSLVARASVEALSEYRGSALTNRGSARTWSSTAWGASTRRGGSDGGCASAPPLCQWRCRLLAA